MLWMHRVTGVQVGMGEVKGIINGAEVLQRRSGRWRGDVGGGGGRSDPEGGVLG